MGKQLLYRHSRPRLPVQFNSIQASILRGSFSYDTKEILSVATIENMLISTDALPALILGILMLPFCVAYVIVTVHHLLKLSSVHSTKYHYSARALQLQPMRQNPPPASGRFNIPNAGDPSCTSSTLDHTTGRSFGARRTFPLMGTNVTGLDVNDSRS